MLNLQSNDVGAHYEHPSSPEKSNNALKIIGKTIYYIFLGFLVLLLAVNIYSIIARKVGGNKVPKVFGYAYQFVLTGSMDGDAPDSFPAGTMIVIKEQKNYKVGDIVTYTTKQSKTSTTHRIVGMEDGNFITKGDANNTEDRPAVTPEQIEGKVIWESYTLGRIFSFLTSTTGIVVILGLGFLMMYMPTFFSNKRED